MKPWEGKIAPLGFLLAGILFLIAAILPAIKGKAIQPAFLGVGLIFFVMGAVTWRKSGGSAPPAP